MRTPHIVLRGVAGKAGRARITSLLTAIAAVIGFSLASAGSAHADGGTIHHFQHNIGGYCLQSDFYGQVKYSPCLANQQTQDWQFNWIGNGRWQIQNYRTKWCLAVAQGSLVTTPVCDTNNSFELWQLWDNDHQFELANNLYCLDGNISGGPYATQGVCVPANVYQTWTLINI
ncbi:MAG: ricin-type beta-trefoil lectin domain protein [Catenulispora sp.]